MNSLFRVALTATALILATYSAAATPPPAQLFEEVEGSGPSDRSPVIFHESLTGSGQAVGSACGIQYGFGCGSAGAEAQVTNGTPIASVTEDTNTNFGLPAPVITTFVQVYFYAEIIGPSTVTVPANVGYGGYVQGTGQWAGDVKILASSSSNMNAYIYQIVQSSCGPGSGNPPELCYPSFGGIYGVTETTNTPFSVYLEVRCLIAFVNSTCQALADPMITIDPSFNLPGYSVVLSADQPLPVPEPTSYLTMLGGLGVLFARRQLARRRP